MAGGDGRGRRRQAFHCEMARRLSACSASRAALRVYETEGYTNKQKKTMTFHSFAPRPRLTPMFAGTVGSQAAGVKPGKAWSSFWAGSVDRPRGWPGVGSLWIVAISEGPIVSFLVLRPTQPQALHLVAPSVGFLDVSAVRPYSPQRPEIDISLAVLKGSFGNPSPILNTGLYQQSREGFVSTGGGGGGGATFTRRIQHARGTRAARRRVQDAVLG